MVEGQSTFDRTKPIETYFPRDILPTQQFFNPWIPNLGNNWSPEGYIRSRAEIPSVYWSDWNAVTTISGREAVIHMGKLNRSVGLLIETRDREEQWLIDENYRDAVHFKLSRIRIPLTILGSGMKTFWAGEKHWDPGLFVLFNPRCSDRTVGNILDIDIGGENQNGKGMHFVSKEEGISGLLQIRDAIWTGRPLREGQSVSCRHIGLDKEESSPIEHI